MPEHLATSLARRMAGPQRHRLLQGYPALPLMRSATAEPLARRRLDGSLTNDRDPRENEPPFITIDPDRKLIVGLIPHTLCTPKRAGCGFCTFGQDNYRRGAMKSAVSGLRLELDAALEGLGHDFRGRKVEALYFGGGTANLTPIGDLDDAFGKLARTMNLRDAELTLEGVPSLFVSRFSAALRWLAKLPVRRPRISMGIQTFDPVQLQRMGRQHFGDVALVTRVVHEARKRGIGTSGDFLFNLPHQTRAAMLGDLEQAVAIGFDQICIYHLVLYAGLGTAWSRDPELLAALPDNDEAVGNWLALRAALLAAGYVQTTLTNFERADIQASDHRFLYEELSFSPDRVDGLGIGPLSLSTFIDRPQRRAVKLLRSRETYPEALPYNWTDMLFRYEPVDLELLDLTRSLPRLGWSAALLTNHPEFVRTIVDAGLATQASGEDLALTPRGMFFADAIVGLLAERRTAELRGPAGEGMHTLAFVREQHHHMG